jgi:hypothetical protein
MRWYRALVVACVVVGIVLRARGFFFSPRPLWLDEASWANKLVETKLLEPTIRPIGFMAASKFLVFCFGAREQVLRLLPWLAGVGTTLLIVPLAERLLTSRPARLLLIGVITLHPVAIDFSKEFKPYSLSLFLHFACLFLALRYLDTRRTSLLAAVLGTALVGLLFTQDVVFALPGLYLVVTITAWRWSRWGDVAVCVGFGLLTIGLLLVLYFYFWRALEVGPSGDDSYWAIKYDVFYTYHKHGEALWHWVLRKWGDIAAFLGYRSKRWSPFLGRETTTALAAVYGGFWIVLHIVGLVQLARRRRFTALVLLLTPLVTVLGFNLLGFWPFGAFRTNLFILAYVAPIAAFAIEGIRPLERVGYAPLLAAVVLPLVVFERDWHAQKLWAGESQFFDLSAALVSLQGPATHGKAEPLVLDTNVCSLFGYYLSVHPDYHRLKKDFRQRFSRTCRPGRSAFADAQETAATRRTWLVMGSMRDIADVKAQLDDLENVVNYRDFHSAIVLELGPGRI